MISRITKVRKMIDRPQPKPDLSWQNFRIPSEKSIEGLKDVGELGAHGERGL